MTNICDMYFTRYSNSRFLMPGIVFSRKHDNNVLFLDGHIISYAAIAIAENKNDQVGPEENKYLLLLENLWITERITVLSIWMIDISNKGPIKPSHKWPNVGFSKSNGKMEQVHGNHYVTIRVQPY